MLPLHEGWALLDGLVEDAGRHRERLEHWWQTHPVQGTISHPIVIAGSYRTGTTFLHRALASAMPECRTLLGWEANIPTPPPVTGLVGRLQDPRCAQQQEVTDALFDLDPELRDMHYEPADLPCECVQAMAHTGLTGLWPAISHCPEYVDYLLSTDGYGAYVYYSACLQTLDVEARWLLKSPMHSLFLDAIAQLWPTATIIRICREPSSIEDSAVRFFSHLRSLSKPGEDHGDELRGWVGPYLREHDHRVNEAQEWGIRVINVDAAVLRVHPERVVCELREELRAELHV